MPNAHVCEFDGTYYKITTTNYISKTSLYITFRMYPLGPWPLKILTFALLVTREIATYSWPWEKSGNHSTTDLMPRLLINLFTSMYSSFTSWPPFRSQNALIHAHTLSFVTFLGNFTKIQVLNSSSQHENLVCARTHGHSSVSYPTFIRSLAGIKVPNPNIKP